jgi:hypothetical protein
MRTCYKRLYRLREKKPHLFHGFIQEGKGVRVSMVERDATRDMNIRLTTIKMGLKGMIGMIAIGIDHINKTTILRGMAMAIQI